MSFGPKTNQPTRKDSARAATDAKLGRYSVGFWEAPGGQRIMGIQCGSKENAHVTALLRQPGLNGNMLGKAG